MTYGHTNSKRTISSLHAKGLMFFISKEGTLNVVSAGYHMAKMKTRQLVL